MKDTVNDMRIVRSLIIAFSSYSKIPMPQFEWKKEDMKYIMAFFPLIGLVIGALEYLWFRLGSAWHIADIARCIIAALLPVMITGGFHVDGFMDTSDAISSYQDRESRLRILKDSHIGAFAVIRLTAAAGLFTAAVSQINTSESCIVFGMSFILSRCLSAEAVLHFASASRSGSLFYTATNSERRINTLAAGITAVITMAVMIAVSPLHGIFAAAACLLSFVYYRIMSYKKFGGITGDLAGYFVVICEVAAALAIAAACVIKG